MRTDATDYESCRRLIHWFGSRAYRRLIAAGGRAVEYDDVIQELNIAWTIAREKWNPDMGVPFVAYLKRGMQLAINRFIDRELRFDQNASHSLQFSALEGESEFSEIVADTETHTPEDIVMASLMTEYAFDQLSPLARSVLECVLSPPNELQAELNALQAKKRYAKERGFCVGGVSEVSLSFVMDFFGLKRNARASIYAELSQFRRSIAV